MPAACRATSDMSHLKDMDAIDICVPTPLRKTKDPDLSYVVQAVDAVKAHLKKGQLVILESTTYPGTTDEVVQPALEESGLKAGVDFYLAFSPERVDPGNESYSTRTIPKVVGGVNRESTELASDLYGSIVETVVPVSSTQVAEMVKLLENTFRAVNIGLVNEIALDGPPDEHRRVGSHRRGRHQTVRVHAVLSGARPRRALHSDRSVLPVLEGAPERIRVPVHRAGRPRQLLDARVRRRADWRGAEYEEEGRSTDRGFTCSASPTRRTSATCASRRRWTSSSSCIGAALSSPIPIPSSRCCSTATSIFEPCRRPNRRQGIDCAVICTNHRVFDYPAIVRRYPLIVDTRNALKGIQSEHIFRL